MAINCLFDEEKHHKTHSNCNHKKDQIIDDLETKKYYNLD